MSIAKIHILFMHLVKNNTCPFRHVDNNSCPIGNCTCPVHHQAIGFWALLQTHWNIIFPSSSFICILLELGYAWQFFFFFYISWNFSIQVKLHGLFFFYFFSHYSAFAQQPKAFFPLSNKIKKTINKPFVTVPFWKIC